MKKEKERNEFKEVKEFYGESEAPVVLDITAEVMPDEHYGEDGEFCGVCATAQVIFPAKDHILFGGKIHSGGLWGLAVDDEKEIDETLSLEVEELKRMLDKLNVNYSHATIKKESHA